MDKLINNKDYEYVDNDGYTTLNIFEHVTEIPEEQFCCGQFNKIIFPSGLKKIGASSFYLCKELYDITLPDSVEIIESGAFSCCGKLTKVKFPKNIKIIGSTAFFQTSITNFDLPNGLKVIGSRAFSRTDSSFRLYVPPSVKIIGTSAFEGSNFNYLKLNEGLNIIGMNAFNYRISAHKIPKSVKFYDNFYVNTTSKDYTIYGKTLAINDGVKAIYRFEDYSELAEIDTVIMPESVEYIGTSAFKGLDIENVVFPKNLKYIGEYAFNDCKKLDSVILPNSVIFIGELAFYSGRYPIPINVPDTCYIDGYSNAYSRYTSKDNNTSSYSELLEKESAFLNEKGLSQHQIEENKKSISNEKSNNVKDSSYNYLKSLLSDPEYDEDKIIPIAEQFIKSGFINVKEYDSQLLLHPKSNKILYLFLRYGYDFEKKHLLLETIKYNDIELVKTLLLMGANPNCKDSIGFTPLMHSVLKGNSLITKMLIDYGADINTYSNQGKTALDYARESGYEEIIDMLCPSNTEIVNSEIQHLQLLLSELK